MKPRLQAPVLAVFGLLPIQFGRIQPALLVKHDLAPGEVRRARREDDHQGNYQRQGQRPDFQGDLRDYMQIPTMAVIVDTTSEGVDKFIDNLLDNNYKSKQKKGLLKYLDLIAKPHEVLKRKDVTFQDQKATIVEVRQAYSMEVSERGSDRASVVNDFKTGSMFFTVRGGRILVIHIICEYQTSSAVMQAFETTLNSLKFLEAAKGAETPE